MRTTTIAALVLAGALGLTGCGSDSDQGSSSSTSSSSGSGSSASGGSGTTVDGAALATRLTNAMVEAGSGTMTVELGSGRRVTGSFAVRGDTMDQQMTVPFQGQTMQVVSTGGVLYLKGAPGASKPWVKVDPTADDPFSRIFSGVAKAASDPREMARAVSGTSVTVVGTSGGVTEYTATVDPAEVFGGLGSDGSAMGAVETHYFVDAQDRPTKLVAQVDGHEVVVTFGDWGKPVSITAPPADQVGSFEIPGT